jgi:hypothetical protein
VSSTIGQQAAKSFKRWQGGTDVGKTCCAVSYRGVVTTRKLCKHKCQLEVQTSLADATNDADSDSHPAIVAACTPLSIIQSHFFIVDASHNSAKWLSNAIIRNSLLRQTWFTLGQYQANARPALLPWNISTKSPVSPSSLSLFPKREHSDRSYTLLAFCFKTHVVRTNVHSLAA